jgi:AcrR family transcriptional regulator
VVNDERRLDDAALLQLLWRGEEQPSPRSGLTVGKIVRAGIELADAAGLEALTMRRVAEQLGVGTMSLYTYVPGKGELLDLMVDRVYGERADENECDEAQAAVHVSLLSWSGLRESSPWSPAASYRQRRNFAYPEWGIARVRERPIVQVMTPDHGSPSSRTADPQMISVLFVEDHASYRQALRAVIATERDLQPQPAYAAMNAATLRSSTGACHMPPALKAEPTMNPSA